MEASKDYKEFLNDPDFLKWGIIISSFVWSKFYREIEEALGPSKGYISKIIKKFSKDKKVYDGRVTNGGHNKKISASENEMIQELLEDDRSLSAQKIANHLSTAMEIICFFVKIFFFFKAFFCEKT